MAISSLAEKFIRKDMLFSGLLCAVICTGIGIELAPDNETMRWIYGTFGATSGFTLGILGMFILNRANGLYRNRSY